MPQSINPQNEGLAEVDKYITLANEILAARKVLSQAALACMLFATDLSSRSSKSVQTEVESFE